MRLRGMTFALVLALFGGAATAQKPTTPSPTEPKTESAAPAATVTPSTPAVVAHALDAADLGAFFDGIIPLQLERSDIAGATVLVMQDGKVLLQKGYGYADTKEKKAVDPVSTIFRLASISKLFTWVSVMQLEEQGKLDLDTDVNTYLDFKIRDAFGKPVTLRNLMTHTGGFEEETRDVLLIKPTWTPPTLQDFLITNQPIRLFPPGTVPGYSNYGVGLAGYIVQRVSGEPFEQYVASHIFAPLGMVHSTFDQPPQKDLDKLPAEGYRWSSQKDPLGFEIFYPAPAGGVSSTAADMSRFAQALLGGGELEGKRVLKSETLARMFTPQFRASEQMPPICMGFYETWRNNLRWIGHGGDLIAFHSLFAIERTKKLVLFVSFNSASASSKTRPEILSMFSDRYFPSGHKQTFVTLPAEQMKPMEGTFQSTRRSDSTKMRLDVLMSQLTAKLDKEGALTFDEVKDLRGHIIKWKPIATDLLQEEDGQRRLFAIRDARGNVVRFASDFPGAQIERIRWYENEKFVLVALGLSVVIVMLAALAGLSRTFQRLALRNRPKPEPQAGTRWLPRTTQVTAWVWVLLAGTVTYVVSKADEMMPPNDSWVKYFYLLNMVTGIAIFLSLLAIFSGLLVWPRGDLRTITKVKFSLVALSCLFLCWFVVHWNIIGPASRF